MKRTLLFGGFVMLFLLFVQKVGAQQWTNFTPQNTSTTLADNAVHAVVIDNKNVMWFGTESGLSRYDGASWRVYNSSNSGLTNEFINTIYIDSAGRKWIGTNDGLFIFNDTDWIHYNVANSGIANNVVNSVVWNKGYYWIATYGGVSRFNGYNWSTYTSLNGLAADMVYSVSVDSKGTLWFGTAGGGASRFDGNTWTTYNKTNGLADNGVSAVFADADDNIWFGTWGGLNKLTGTNFKTYNTMNSGLPDNSIQSISQAKDGTMLIGTWNRGAASLKGSFWKTFLTKDGLAHYRVYSSATDTNNHHWFATAFGVSEFNDTTWTNHYTDGLVAGSVRCMTIDKNNAKWFGTSRGVVYFDNSKWTSYEFKNDTLLPDTIVTGITSDHDNNIWIATKGQGLYKFSGANRTIYRTYNSGIRINSLNGITTDTSNRIWIATTNKGISIFDGTNWSSQTKTNGMAEDYINCISINKSNHKWAGLDNKGADVFYDTVWSNYNTSNSLIASNKVLSIAFDTFGHTWFAASNAGVASFDGVNWQSYTKVQGLVDNRTSSIAIDKYNNKWIGTAAGVSKYDDAVWTNYTTNDGLYSDLVYYIATDKEGYIWICTNLGISRFHPNLPGEGVLTGNIITCRNSTNNTYTVTTVKGATSYEWTLPPGATGSSTTNTIQVDFGPNATSGMISVRAKNAYGAGNSSSRYVLVERYKPAQAGTMTGKTAVKKNTGFVGYSVGIIKDATSYIWTLPAGVTGTSNTNSIMLTFTGSAVSGYVSVKGHNECGDGIESKLYVTVTGIKENNLSDKIELYPNPFTDEINLKMDVSLTGSSILQLYNISGQCVFEKQLNDAEQTISTHNLPQGIYTAKIVTGDGVFTKLIVK